MQHLHDDALTLLALGEEATEEERAHLEACPRCSADLGSFRRVVSAARLAGASTADDDASTAGATGAAGQTSTLQAPDSSVWENIHRELNLDEELKPDPLSAPVAARASAPPASPSASSSAAASSNASSSIAAAGAGSPVSFLDAARRRRRRTAAWSAAAAAAVVVAAAGTWGALGTFGSDPKPVAIASVELSPLASYSDTGRAVVDELADGKRELVVTASSDAAQGFREVWLLAPDATSMVSLGTMEGTEGHFVLPQDLDLSKYPVVDISDEPYDGDPAHSGDSILRGQLDL